ncbi:MAG TPA: HAD hydrolase family protein [Casimicrobiaceae bacterium]|jgi:P-type E1-E2 ATPase
MLELTIPGFGRLELTDAVCDYNGTLAADGLLLEGVRERLQRLSTQLRVHVVTADTFGSAAEQLQQLHCTLTVLDARNQAEAKRDFVQRLGGERVAAIGNGRNDRMMLEHAALGIAVCGAEGAAAEALHASDILVRDVIDALDLLLKPKRLVATLRE